jgi:hypothetical protein
MVEYRFELFREIALGTVQNSNVFVDIPPGGRSPFYVICNSIPEADRSRDLAAYR